MRTIFRVTVFTLAMLPIVSRAGVDVEIDKVELVARAGSGGSDFKVNGRVIGNFSAKTANGVELNLNRAKVEAETKSAKLEIDLEAISRLAADSKTDRPLDFRSAISTSSQPSLKNFTCSQAINDINETIAISGSTDSTKLKSVAEVIKKYFSEFSSDRIKPKASSR